MFGLVAGLEIFRGSWGMNASRLDFSSALAVH